MAYGWGEHTGELELWVAAASEGDVFEEALRAVAELLGDEDDAASGAASSRLVAVEGGDHARLLAGWLEELAFLAETEAFVPERAEELRLAPAGVSARIVGRIGTPPHPIKAGTVPRPGLRPAHEGWG